MYHELLQRQRYFQKAGLTPHSARFPAGFFSATLTLIDDLLPGFHFVEEHSLVEGMAEFIPFCKLLSRIPAVRNISTRIIVLEHC